MSFYLPLWLIATRLSLLLALCLLLTSSPTAVCLLTMLLGWEKTLICPSSSLPLLETFLLEAMALFARVIASFKANFWLIWSTTLSYMAFSFRNSLRPGLPCALLPGVDVPFAVPLVEIAYRRKLVLTCDLWEEWPAWLRFSIISYRRALPAWLASTPPMDLGRTVVAREMVSA